MSRTRHRLPAGRRVPARARAREARSVEGGGPSPSPRAPTPTLLLGKDSCAGSRVLEVAHLGGELHRLDRVVELELGFVADTAPRDRHKCR